MPWPPPSVTYQVRALTAWIWYGLPRGRRLGSRTQSASRLAGEATMPSAFRPVRIALVDGVPNVWANRTTSPLSSL